MIVLLHDFLLRGAKRVLIAVAASSERLSLSLADVTFRPGRWIFAVDFATVLYAARSTSTYQSGASCRRV